MPHRPAALLLAGILLAGSAPALAQGDAWPTRPVRLVVPYAPGGTTDQVARPFADRLSQAFGQQFVIENKGGATGAIGTEAVAKAPKDGYTFLVGPVGAIAIVPRLRKVPYEPVVDLVAVARMADNIGGLAIHPSVPANTFKEFVAYARANRGKVNHGTAGIGSIQHIRNEAISFVADMGLVHVPYRGSAEALSDLLAGNIQMMSEPVVLNHAKSGKLRALAVLDIERNPDLPDVPTLNEAGSGIGFDNFEMPSWVILFGPAGVPAPIVEKINGVIVAASREPAMRETMRKLGYRLSQDKPAEVGAAVKRHTAMFADLIARIGLKQE